MSVPCVPSPRYFFGLDREADRLFCLQLQDVNAVCRAPNLREQPSLIIAEVQVPISCMPPPRYFENADLLAPVIWFVAPLSRTHCWCSCCLPPPPWIWNRNWGHPSTSVDLESKLGTSDKTDALTMKRAGSSSSDWLSFSLFLSTRSRRPSLATAKAAFF